MWQTPWMLDFIINEPQKYHCHLRVAVSLLHPFDLSMWNLHVLNVSVWILSGYSVYNVFLDCMFQKHII